MDGTMSQEEINALLNNPSGTDENPENTLTEQEKDAIGEISNISMGTAATTLFSLVNRKVEISTPVVAFANWSDICDAYEKPCVFITKPLQPNDCRGLFFVCLRSSQREGQKNFL